MRRPQLAAFLMSVALVSQPTPARAQLPYPPIVYPGPRFAAPDSNLQIKVKPLEAHVFVDGYLAGKVDEFDGAFQRLHVTPGQHGIVIYLEGFRSLRQKLYLSPNATRKIEGALEKLLPGEPIEPMPAPAPDAGRSARQDPSRMPPPPAPNPRRGRPDDNDPREGRLPPDDHRSRSGTPDDARSGTLSIRVQPAGATVLIDGERWTGPADDERLIVQLPEGRHRVEIERDGYTRLVVEVDVRRGETAPVNVSLARAR